MGPEPIEGDEHALTDTPLTEDYLFALLATEFKSGIPDEEQFWHAASKWRLLFGNVPAAQFNYIVRRIQTKLQVRMDRGVAITSSDHRPWFADWQALSSPAERRFWSRFETYLITEGWSPAVISALDTVSSEVMDLIGDPRTPTGWERRGLVLGDVQSGKTAMYTAVCNKAADAGYRVIIILAGTQENLRVQTQDRLDRDFSGCRSITQLNPTQLAPVGVGRFGQGGLRATAFTSTASDFSSPVVKAVNLTLRNLVGPALFVVKKNSRILRNLRSWLASNNANEDGLIDLPVIVIDDEADNASINTKAKDDDPTAINAGIRDILKMFHRSSYVGVTATPFANIFISPDTESDMHGDDLFPRHFIYSLSAPSNYLGPTALFGEDTDQREIQIIDEGDLAAVLPPKHKKDHRIPRLPDSLKEALAYFVLVNAIQDARADSPKHRSMLVNVTPFTDVQGRLKELVSQWLYVLRSSVDNYAGLDEDQAMGSSALKHLRAVWHKHDLDRVSEIPWRALQATYLRPALAQIQVRAVNQTTGTTSLDYAARSDHGLRVIAIGGNSLSRGLTLEGLSVSYFARHSQMYDTLLQMGRWFGYRTGYEDLVKVWLTSEARDWYGDIVEAASELKREIARMNMSNHTPMDFGLKVREDPHSLIVTARNKMQAAQVVERFISVAGRLLETPRLQISSVRANERAANHFLDRLQELGGPPEGIARGYFWTATKVKDDVVRLLGEFQTHPLHLAFQGSALADYVAGHPGLQQWDVLIPNGTAIASYQVAGLTVHPQERKVQVDGDMLRVSGTKARVSSGGITRVGLSEEEVAAAERTFHSLPGSAEKNTPDYAFLIETRRPLLIIHVLHVRGESDSDLPPGVPEIVFALGLGLPRDELGSRLARYRVNAIELLSWGEDEED